MNAHPGPTPPAYSAHTHTHKRIFAGGCPRGTAPRFEEFTNSQGVKKYSIGCFDCAPATYKTTACTGQCKPCDSGTRSPATGATTRYLCTQCDISPQDEKRGSCTVHLEQDRLVPQWACSRNQYYGENCTKKCNCGGGTCDLHSGDCSRCPFPFWGSSHCEHPWFVMLTLASIGVVVGGGFYAFATARRKRWRHRREVMNLQLHSALLEEDHHAEIEEFESAFQIMEHDIEFDERLAAGGFGEVWRGRYHAFPGELVAIKKMFLTPANTEDVLRRGAFGDKEIAFLARMPAHPHIVYRIGAGQLASSQHVFLVSEFMAGGDLRRCLNEADSGGSRGVGGGNGSGRRLTWPQRVSFARDIADGMAFLHSKGMIHRDLKSLNVLLDAQWTKAKIADFGLSKLTGSHHAIMRSCSDSGPGGDHDCGGRRPRSRPGSSLDRTEMLAVAKDMATAVTHKNRVWARGVVTDSFKGSDAVSWLVTSGHAPTRVLAMTLGTRIVRAGFVQPAAVCEEKRQHAGVTTLMDDKRVLYRFTAPVLTELSPRSDGAAGGGSGGGGSAAEGRRSATSSAAGGETDSVELSVSGAGSSGGDSSGAGSPHQTRLTGNVGSLLWMAPEILRQGGAVATYGLASDVFSYGVLLYEIVTRRVPWEELPDENSFFQIRYNVITGRRPPFGAEDERAAAEAAGGGARLLVSLMRRAWAQDPAARPCMDEIFRELASLSAASAASAAIREQSSESKLCGTV